MQLALFQGIAKKHRAATTIEMKASENPVLQNIQADPTIVCTSFKKNRFYMVCGSTRKKTLVLPIWLEFYFLVLYFQLKRMLAIIADFLNNQNTILKH